ncbi:MAG: apolipoprotein N-acyltransferase [Bacteroidia bacterium]
MGSLKKTGLAVLSGLLLGSAWFSPFTFLIFIGFVPLLFVTADVSENSKRPKRSVYLYSYLSFLIWNAIVTWWTWFASPGGCLFANTVNALIMATVYLLFFALYRAFQRSKFSGFALWSLLPVWLGFEYFHNNWELAWNWVALGNVFSFQTKWIQWYEFTGVPGGSLWALATNILVYGAIKAGKGNLKFNLVKIAGVIIVPVIISFIVLPSSNQKVKRFLNNQNVVVVQPNIDPYEEKFFVAYGTQLVQVYEQLKGKITDKTDYLVLPETFFTENIWENDIESAYSVKFLRDSLLKKFPNLKIVTGASTLYKYEAGDILSPTARKFSDADEYYESFNTGLQLDNAGPMQIYHKSKLVPGVERMPYPAFFKPLEKLTIDLGGTSGSLGTQEERTVFFNKDKTVGVAPVICYESVFGEYVTEYIKKGANMIFIITNDGWWRDSPGYRHHLNYAKLRAIETRKPIARCANTGISCFIDARGEISQATKWWEPAVIEASLTPNNEQTFYIRFGDWISKIASGLLMLSVVAAIFLKKK